MALAPDRKGFFLLRTLLALTYRNWISFYSHFSHHYWIVPFLVLNVLMVNWNFSVSLIWTDFIASLWQDFMTNKGVTSDFFFHVGEFSFLIYSMVWLRFRIQFWLEFWECVLRVWKKWWSGKDAFWEKKIWRWYIGSWCWLWSVIVAQKKKKNSNFVQMANLHRTPSYVRLKGFYTKRPNKVGITNQFEWKLP